MTSGQVSFTVTNRFPASATNVFAMLTDPEFLEAAVEATEPLEFAASVDGQRYSTRRLLRTPPAFAAIVGPTLDVRDEVIWEPAGATGPWRGQVLIEIEGQPVRISGSVWLEAAPDHTTMTYDCTATAEVGMFATAVASEVARVVAEAIGLQEETGLAYLAKRGLARPGSLGP